MEELGHFVYVLDILSVLSIFMIGSAALSLIVLSPPRSASSRSGPVASDPTLPARCSISLA
jgi:hypothetical protein